MGVIADKHGVNQIQLFNQEGWLVYSTDPQEKPSLASTSSEACVGCHGAAEPSLLKEQ